MSELLQLPSDTSEGNKLEFEHRTSIFEQDCADFRSINAFLWQIPIIVATLTGGLWFGVTKIGNDSFIRASLFLLATTVNLLFIIVVWRLRFGVMRPILKRMNAYKEIREPCGSYTVISAFTFILALSGLISLLAFIHDARYFVERILEVLCITRTYTPTH